MRPRSQAGITLPEILVGVVIGLILVWLALPSTNTPARYPAAQTLSNTRQLWLATQQMALDRSATGGTNLGWPGDIGGTFANWTRELVAGNYLTTNDLCKLLSAPAVAVPPGKMPGKERSGLLVYAIRTASASEAVFLTSANFTNTSTGGLPPKKNAKPFGDKGFIVLRKGGDGMMLQSRQAGQTNIIGSFVPLCQ